MLGPIYWVISWILLEWHSLWNLVFRGSEFLKTNWDWVLAIIFLVLTIRGLLFPVFVKQIKSQRAMQALAPQIKALQEKHKGDRETMQREMMELYRTEKANPLMGCLPMVVQLPVFWSLFHVLRHLKPTMPEHLKTLYGWNVAQFDDASSARLFGAPIAASFRSSASDLANMHANATNVKIVAVVLIAMMIATTYMTSRQMILKTGWAQDPQQRMIQKLMLYGIPVSLLISGGLFPLGVVLYWVTTNLFSLGQQFWVLRKYPPPPMAASAGAGILKSTSATKTTAGTSGTRSNSPAKSGGKKSGIVASSNGMAARTGSILGRKPKVDDTVDSAPKVDGRSLAPKPGARPVNPKKGKPPAKRTG